MLRRSAAPTSTGALQLPQRPPWTPHRRRLSTTSRAEGFWTTFWRNGDKGKARAVEQDSETATSEAQVTSDTRPRVTNASGRESNLVTQSTFSVASVQAPPKPVAEAISGAQEAAATVQIDPASARTSGSTTGRPPDPPTNRQASSTTTAPRVLSALERDAELMRKLLDREGGSAGVGTADHWEGAMGKETKKNMFRVI